MDVELLHPEHMDYPATDIDWAAAEIYPIGVVQIEDGGEFYPLAIAQQGRLRALFAVVDGSPQLLDLEQAGPALYDALDAACTRLWGHSWNAALGEIFGVNRRTLQRDRVSRYLLPARLLMTIAYVASADDAEQLAYILIGVAKYATWDKLRGNRHAVEGYIEGAVKLYYEEDQVATLSLKF